MITPKLAKLLTIAICRNINKHYPSPGIVGVYGFNGQTYSRKPALREAVLEFCLKLEYSDLPYVRKTYGLI